MAEISYRRHRFPPVIIQHAVWVYLRFTLSYRDVEELLAERGLDISYETVRCWVLKFTDLELVPLGSWLTPRWRGLDSNLYGAFPVKWCFSVYCQFSVRRLKGPFLIPSPTIRFPARAQWGQGSEML